VNNNPQIVTSDGFAKVREMIKQKTQKIIKYLIMDISKEGKINGKIAALRVSSEGYLKCVSRRVRLH
jgi:hypothetical protein